jgi:hypothetical protein
MTSGWYLLVFIAILVTGFPGASFGAGVVAVLIGAGPLFLAAGCLAWTGMWPWAARTVGLLIMVGSLVPLVSFSGLLIPFVLLSLPAAWPWAR